MLDDLTLPDGVVLVRTTPTFDATSVPAGLRQAHRVATGVWGLLRVLDGEVVFVMETTGERRTVAAGEEQVIPPDADHHVEPSAEARFEVAFYR